MLCPLGGGGGQRALCKTWALGSNWRKGFRRCPQKINNCSASVEATNKSPAARSNHNSKFQWNRLIIFAVILYRDRTTDSQTDSITTPPRWNNSNVQRVAQQTRRLRDRRTDRQTHSPQCDAFQNNTRPRVVRVGMCGKPKICSDSILKTKPSKNLTSVQTVFRQKLRAIRNSN